MTDGSSQQELLDVILEHSDGVVEHRRYDLDGKLVEIRKTQPSGFVHGAWEFPRFFEYA